jgi:hypothetical protein
MIKMIKEEYFNLILLFNYKLITMNIHFHSTMFLTNIIVTNFIIIKTTTTTIIIIKLFISIVNLIISQITIKEFYYNYFTIISNFLTS